MISFDFQPRTRIVFGPDKVDTLGELAGELGARRALVVSDSGIVAAGHTQRGLDALKRAGIEAHLFDGVEENPTTAHVRAGLQLAKRHEPELIVGLGGGSSMDCAKGINFVYSGGGKIQDYWGVGKMTKEMLPMIAVPTTAGTGSETQSFALISDEHTHVKMACGDKKASFRAAILDPTLTLTLPAKVTAVTGIDAIAHALETYVTTKRNAASLAFSREAWQLLEGNFARVLEHPDDLVARGEMQLGACFAGLAIENSMLGATHALANPLTAEYGIPHGEAIGLMLPHVVRYNGQEYDHWYHELLETTVGSNGDHRHGPAFEVLSARVAALVAKAGLPTRLSERGVASERLPQLAADAAKQWTGTFNPRKVGAEELLELYRQALQTVVVEINMATSTVERPDVVLKPFPEPGGRACGTVVFLLDNGELEVPPLRSLAEFREWARSDDFPQYGRIDYIAGRIEVDMSPQDLYCHGTVNGEIYYVLYGRVKQDERGQLFINQTRLSAPDADLSSEPDILFVSYEALESGKIRRIAKANDRDRYVELEGAADLAVETISDSSVGKDTVQLPIKYYRANVTEFWLVDARGEDLLFQIYRRGPTAFELAPTNTEGYQYSAVMDCWYRLERYRDRVGDWAYELKEKPSKEDSP